MSRKLTEAMGDRDRGFVYDAGNLTVGEYLTQWLEDSVKGTVRESTYERYGYAIRPHIKPALGRLKLKNLTTVHVRGFYREKLDTGLAPATVHKLHVVLHKALDQAVYDELIPRNVTQGIKLPRLSSETVDPLSTEEASRLLEAASGDRLKALYVLAIHAGLRLGELLALRWEDADLERDILKVRHTITYAGGEWRIGETKSGKGRKVRLTRPAARGTARPPQAPARGADTLGWAVGGDRSHLLERDWWHHQSLQPPQPLVHEDQRACRCPLRYAIP